MNLDWLVAVIAVLFLIWSAIFLLCLKWVRKVALRNNRSPAVFGWLFFFIPLVAIAILATIDGGGQSQTNNGDQVSQSKIAISSDKKNQITTRIRSYKKMILVITAMLVVVSIAIYSIVIYSNNSDLREMNKIADQWDDSLKECGFEGSEVSRNFTDNFYSKEDVITIELNNSSYAGSKKLCFVSKMDSIYREFNKNQKNSTFSPATWTWRFPAFSAGHGICTSRATYSCLTHKWLE
jgi:beta-lactamase regulating signal transducer with metallopeptidase domain